MISMIYNVFVAASTLAYPIVLVTQPAVIVYVFLIELVVWCCVELFIIHGPSCFLLNDLILRLVTANIRTYRTFDGIFHLKPLVSSHTSESLTLISFLRAVCLLSILTVYHVLQELFSFKGLLCLC